MRFNCISTTALVLAGLVAATGARATPLPVTLGDPFSITSGDVTASFTVTNCSVTGGSCADFLVVQDGPSLGFTILPASGTSIVSNPPSNDLSFDLNLISSTQPISGIYASVDGSGAGSSAGLALSGLSLIAYAGQPDSARLLPSTSFTVSYDIGADAFTPGSQVTSVTTDFAVPEPASLTLLAAGVGLTALLRRRRRS